MERKIKFRCTWSWYAFQDRTACSMANNSIAESGKIISFELIP